MPRDSVQSQNAGQSDGNKAKATDAATDGKADAKMDDGKKKEETKQAQTGRDQDANGSYDDDEDYEDNSFQHRFRGVMGVKMDW